MSASDDDLVPKKGATSIVWKWFGYKRSDLQKSTIFCKICKKTVTTNGGNTTNLFHLKQKHTVEYNQAMKVHKEEILAVGDVRPKSKRMTQLSITGALACTPYDKKSKRWMEITVRLHIVWPRI